MGIGTEFGFFRTFGDARSNPLWEVQLPAGGTVEPIAWYFGVIPQRGNSPPDRVGRAVPDSADVGHSPTYAPVVLLPAPA